MSSDVIELANGVKLRDWHDHNELRSGIYEGVREELGKSFPVSYGGLRLDLVDLDYEDPDNFDYTRQKRAIMESQTLGRRLRGTFRLFDEESNTPLDEKKVTLMNVPHLTERGTFIHNGSEYTTINQLRLLPGAYTRRKENGELETQFNVRRGTGSGFKLRFEPSTALYKMDIGQSSLRLYSLLRDLGVSDDDLEAAWGSEILEINRKAYDPRVFNKAYQRLVKKPDPEADPRDKAEAIRQALDAMRIHRRVANRNLPGMFTKRSSSRETSGDDLNHFILGVIDRAKRASATAPTVNSFVRPEGDDDDYTTVGLEGLLAASEKLLRVNQGVEQPDERDSLIYKHFMTPDRMLKERIRMDADQVRRHLMRRIRKNRNLKSLGVGSFNPYTEGLIIGNPLSLPLEEINPMHLVDQHRRITHMGPGGLPSSDVVTESMQSVHPSQFGFISALEGPECFDDQTEVYLQRGWTAWKDVRDDDVFACRVHGRLEWHRADRVVRESYQGPILIGESATIRMAVTPNHRVLRRTGQKGYRVDLATDVYGKNITVPIRHLPYPGTNDSHIFELPETAKTNNNQKINAAFDIVDWCRLMGWWLSEGDFNQANIALKSGNGCYQQSRLRISQCSIANPENHEEIKSLLVRMGLMKKPNESGSSFCFGNKQLTDYFSLWNSGCYDKWIPEELFEVSVEARQALLDALLKGDGRYNAKRWCYCTVSRRLAESVERLAISLGYTAFIRIERDSREHVKTTNFIVSIHRQSHRTIWNSTYPHPNGKSYGGQWRQEAYNGKVYCATVPGGFLHVRGKPSTSGFWSGNSEMAGVDVRAAWGTRIGSDGNIYQRFRNRKTGEFEWHSPVELDGRAILLPN